MRQESDCLGEKGGFVNVTQFDFLVPPGKQEVITTNLFAAPASLVFKAITDAELIPQWWGPGDLTTSIEKLELRPGGAWRFVQRDAAGESYAFHGFYHAIEAPIRLVYTFEFEGMPGHVLLSTSTLTEQAGQTRLTEQSVYQSVADRDGMVATGMQRGNMESAERLEKLLTKLCGRI
jgi:uncharacterized protein YndB with AHSA1/START domain